MTPDDQINLPVNEIVKPLLLEYKGWTLRWTTFKSQQYDYNGNAVYDRCAKCDGTFTSGEPVYLEFNSDRVEHWACYGQPHCIWGQILAVWKPNTSREKLLYVSVPGGEGEFVRGGTFSIELLPGQKQLLADTPIDELVAAVRTGFERMKALIDAQPEEFHENSQPMTVVEMLNIRPA